MKVFVINLDRRPDRLAHMSGIFDGLRLKFDRISAVDGTKPSFSQYARPGEIACFLSHRECWRRIVEENLPSAAILEDDLHFAPGAAAILGSGAWVPPEADIIKIETMLRPTKLDKSPVACVSDRELYRLRSSHFGSAGYILTRQGAERLLNASETFNAPVDHFMFDVRTPFVRQSMILQLYPAICVQDFFLRHTKSSCQLGSDLHAERTTKCKVLDKAWREARRPVVQFAKFAQRTGTNLFTGKKWSTVPLT